MGTNRGKRVGRQGIRAVGRWLALALAVSACATAGGATPEDDDAALLATRLAAAGMPTGAVVVRLAFAEAGDFDLYVTGPLEETVYFANAVSRIGGRLLADKRCNGREASRATPRIETVVFEHAPPGRYRVGIDLPERCDGNRGPLPYALEINTPSGTQRRSGHQSPGVFDPIVVEWTEPPKPVP